MDVPMKNGRKQNRHEPENQMRGTKFYLSSEKGFFLAAIWKFETVLYIRDLRVNKLM